MKCSGYMPPEYIKGQKISPKFDVFSLGVIIIKMMAGKEGYSNYAHSRREELIEHVREKIQYHGKHYSTCILLCLTPVLFVQTSFVIMFQLYM